MKTTFSAIFGAIAISLIPSAYASDLGYGYVNMAPKGVSVGLNPSGTYVFGYNGRSGDASQQTWLYDIATETSAAYPPGLIVESEGIGQLQWLGDDGVGVGTFRDDDWAATAINSEGNEEDEYPLNSACIWKDGRRITLDHNKWTDPETFKAQDGTLPSVGNGFYAMRISEDGSKILGYLKAFTYMLPVRWDRNADGTYTSTMLHRVTGEFFYRWVGASADGNRMIMNNSQSGGFSYIWDGDNNHRIFTYSETGSTITEPCLTALSPSGNLAIMSCMRNGQQAYGVYDFTTGTVKWIPLPEGAASSNWFAANVVTDRGDGFICDYNYRLHYFSTELNITIPFASYVGAYGSEMEEEVSVLAEKSLVRMISEDGRTICGNHLQAGLEVEGWIVRLPETKPMLFALRECEAITVSPTRIMLRWIEPELPEGAAIKKYVLEIDGTETPISETEKGDDGYTRAYADCTAGTHQIVFKAVAEDAGGKEWDSVKQNLEITLSENTGLFFFEDLCDSKIDEQAMAYVYMHDTFQAIMAKDSSVLNFRLDAGDFCNLTPFWYTCGFSTAEWHTYLESRWFDATDRADDFYFTWQERNKPINSETVLDANNLLKVEYTIDGENWIELSESDGRSNGDHWNAKYADLSHLAGKMFRLRFHAQGAGMHPCEWRVDYYGIMSADAMYAAPADLMVTASDKTGNTLAWKNNRGEYEVSYNYNSPMTFNNNLGNEGEPFYTACDYGPAKLKAFEGKYITAVATMLYEPEGVEQANHTKVQAVIFDSEGNELSRGTLADDAPWYEAGVSTAMPIHHIVLDDAVLIEPGKTYRVSILITDYEPEMCPIWYFSASDDYIPNVTDLYSDDNLQSWQSLSQYFEDQDDDEEFNLYGRCIFNIRPCITDTPQTSAEAYCQDQWFYEVYRDGELLPDGIAYYTQQSAKDPQGGDAVYTVRSFRRDGAVSFLSEPLKFEASGVRGPQVDAAQGIAFHRVGDKLVITGDFDSVQVYSMMGAKVASSRVVELANLPHGAYVLVLTKDGRSTSVKCMF